MTGGAVAAADGVRRRLVIAGRDHLPDILLPAAALAVRQNGFRGSSCLLQGSRLLLPHSGGMTTITCSRQPADLPAVSDRLTATCVVDDPHVGPPTSGHGGVLAGRLAQQLDPDAGVVRLHAPIPLGTTLTLMGDRGAVLATSGGDLIATARHLAAPLAVAPFDPVDDRDLEAAEADWLDGWQWWHPSPTCFGCGPARTGGLGLRPGRIPGRRDHASRLTIAGDRVGPVAAHPHRVPSWLVWAALDCVGAGPAFGEVAPGVVVVTGELAVEILRPLPAGVELVAQSRLTGRAGRRLLVESAIAGAAGEVLAVSTATWFAMEVTGS